MRQPQRLPRFLSEAARPEGLDEVVWTRFEQVVAAADLTGFSALVGRFEWSTSATSARTITPELLGLLTERSLASDAAEAEQIYQRLFLFVFKRLCEPGVKRLTRSELLQQLSAATLSGTDRATLARLTQCFAVVSSRVDDIEAAANSMSEGVRQIARTQGIHATLLRGSPSSSSRPSAGTRAPQPTSRSDTGPCRGLDAFRLDGSDGCVGHRQKPTCCPADCASGELGGLDTFWPRHGTCGGVCHARYALSARCAGKSDLKLTPGDTSWPASVSAVAS